MRLLADFREVRYLLRPRPAYPVSPRLQQLVFSARMIVTVAQIYASMCDPSLPTITPAPTPNANANPQMAP